MSTFGHPEEHEYHRKYLKYKERYRGIQGTPSIGGTGSVEGTASVKGTASVEGKCTHRQDCNAIRKKKEAIRKKKDGHRTYNKIRWQKCTHHNQCQTHCCAGKKKKKKCSKTSECRDQPQVKENLGKPCTSSMDCVTGCCISKGVLLDEKMNPDLYKEQRPIEQTKQIEQPIQVSSPTSKGWRKVVYKIGRHVAPAAAYDRTYSPYSLSWGKSNKPGKSEHVPPIGVHTTSTSLAEPTSYVSSEFPESFQKAVQQHRHRWTAEDYAIQPSSWDCSGSPYYTIYPRQRGKYTSRESARENCLPRGSDRKDHRLQRHGNDMTHTGMPEEINPSRRGFDLKDYRHSGMSNYPVQKSEVRNTSRRGSAAA